jgi:hypothetical protein
MMQVVVVYSRSSSDVSGDGGWKEMALIVFARFTASMMGSSHAMLTSVVVTMYVETLGLDDRRPTQPDIFHRFSFFFF